MEQLPLRDYLREIERLIENSSFDSAIAHCRHILKSFPKNIDTYRLLGKAYLESQRYTEAVDIFQRVLSVYPDDFLAHLGLSIIKEEQGNLEAAIWHLERAYEVQPSNPALQSELKRLHGRRDGIEPPKIRLTRAALARMYQRGELYPQALAEVQSALAEDPSRIDLEILQAQLLTQLGKHSESLKIASKLVNKLPYSYQANKIISQAVGQTDDPEIVKKARDILSAIDPYEIVSTNPVEPAGGLSEDLFMVEKLVLAGADRPVVPAELQPTTDQSFTAEAEPAESEIKDNPADSAPADIADEIQLPAIEPLEEKSESPVQPETSDTEEFVTDEQRKKVISKMMVDLTDLDGELDPSLEDTVKIAINLKPEELVEEVITPEVQIKEVEPDKKPDPDLPSWLSGLEPKSDQSSEFKGKNGIPDWLFAMDDSLTEADRAELNPAAEDRQPELADTSEIDQAIAWLEGLAEKHGVLESSLLLPTENRVQQAPEWISRLKNILNDEQKQQMESVEEREIEEVTKIVLASSTETVEDETLLESPIKSEDITEAAGKLDGGNESEGLPKEESSLSKISDTGMFDETSNTDLASESPVAEGITPDQPEISSFDNPQFDSEILQESTGASPDEISDETQNRVVLSELADDTPADVEPININQIANTEDHTAADQVIETLTDEQPDHLTKPESISVDLPEVDAEITRSDFSEFSGTIQAEDNITSLDEQISDTEGLEIKQEEAKNKIGTFELNLPETQDTVSVNDELSSLEKLTAENPEDVQTLRQLAKAYTRSGKFDEAKSIYKQIEKILRQ